MKRKETLENTFLVSDGSQQTIDQKSNNFGKVDISLDGLVVHLSSLMKKLLKYREMGEK